MFGSSRSATWVWNGCDSGPRNGQLLAVLSCVRTRILGEVPGHQGDKGPAGTDTGYEPPSIEWATEALTDSASAERSSRCAECTLLVLGLAGVDCDLVLVPGCLNIRCLTSGNACCPDCGAEDGFADMRAFSSTRGSRPADLPMEVAARRAAEGEAGPRSAAGPRPMARRVSRASRRSCDSLRREAVAMSSPVADSTDTETVWQPTRSRRTSAQHSYSAMGSDPASSTTCSVDPIRPGMIDWLP